MVVLKPLQKKPSYMYVAGQSNYKKTASKFTSEAVFNLNVRILFFQIKCANRIFFRFEIQNSFNIVHFINWFFVI